MSDSKDYDRRETVEIDLDFPVTLDGQRIESVTMRRPKGRDSVKAAKVKGGEFEKGIALMSDLVGLPVEQFIELDDVDIEKIQTQYAAFKPASETPAR